ncbi:MAG: type VI secretion system Vgr family protein [Polyangiaceae bacterium]
MKRHHTHIELVIDGGQTLLAEELDGREAFNELSTFRARIQGSESELGFGAEQMDQVLGKPAVVALVDPLEGSTRTIHLIISEVDLLEELASGELRLDLFLEPRQHVASFRNNHAHWVDKTTKEVVDAVCAGLALGPPELEWRTEGAYPTRPQCTQRAESDWAFMLRILADEAISVWFDCINDEPRWVLCDHAEGYSEIEGEHCIPLGASHEVRCFLDFEVEHEVTPLSVYLRDECVRTPSAPIEAAAGDGAGRYFEYPARVVDADDAKQRALRRLEQVRRNAVIGRGGSNCVRMQPGHTFELDAGDSELDGQYAVVAVEHRYRVESEKDVAGTYTNQVTVVPGGVFYRPEIPVWPTIHGAEPATVSGPSGEEIHVNDLGDVKLKFPWDRSPVVDDTTSTWARSMQPNLGGAMFLPRMQWEVLVTYAHGNPDRPCVLGRLYNAEAALPYSSKAEASSSSFQTASTPGGGGVNEIKMSDKAGDEKAGINACHDQDVVVGGPTVTDVGGNQTHTVALSLTGTHATQSVTVGGVQDINVGTDYTITAGGRSETIGGVEKIGVTGDRAVETGSYLEAVGALQATQCVNAMIDCAALVNGVGGAMVHLAGAGANETVTGARVHVVGAVRSIQCANYDEKVKGSKTIVSGASLLQAGGGNATTCATGNVTAASISATASGAVVFEAGAISIKAAKITTPGGTIGGGSLSVSGSDIDGKIIRLAETKLGS